MKKAPPTPVLCPVCGCVATTGPGPMDYTPATDYDGVCQCECHASARIILGMSSNRGPTTG